MRILNVLTLRPYPLSFGGAPGLAAQPGAAREHFRVKRAPELLKKIQFRRKSSAARAAQARRGAGGGGSAGGAGGAGGGSGAVGLVLRAVNEA